MNSKVYMRVDGGSAIGLGHLMRSLSLAHMLSKSFQVEFFCMEISDALRKDFEIKGFAVHVIKEESDFIRYLDSHPIVVLDGYKFDITYQENIKKIGCKLVCIDDLVSNSSLADLVINHSLDASKEDYLVPESTKLALGADYVLLRPAFLNNIAEIKSNSRKESILICFGGADPENLTLKLLNIIYDADFFKQINLVTGASYQFDAEMKIRLKSLKNVNYYHNIDEIQMFEVMKNSDVGVLPASGVLYEMISLQKVVITGMYIEHQRRFLNGIRNIKSIVNCDDFAEHKIYDVIRYVVNNDLIPEKVFDGKSSQRIEQLFQQL